MSLITKEIIKSKIQQRLTASLNGRLGKYADLSPILHEILIDIVDLAFAASNSFSTKHTYETTVNLVTGSNTIIHDLGFKARFVAIYDGNEVNDVFWNPANGDENNSVTIEMIADAPNTTVYLLAF